MNIAENYQQITQTILATFEETTLLFCDELIDSEIPSTAEGMVGSEVPFTLQDKSYKFGVIGNSGVFVKYLESSPGLIDGEVDDIIISQVCDEITNIIIGVFLDEIENGDSADFTIPTTLNKSDLVGIINKDKLFSYWLRAEDYFVLFYVEQL